MIVAGCINMGVLSAMRDMKNIDAVKEVKFCAKQFIDSVQCL